MDYKVSPELEHYNRLSNRVSSLETDVKNIAAGVDNLAKSMQNIAEKVSASSRTNWGVLAGWASAVIAMVTMLGYLTIEPMNQSVKELRKWNERLSDRQLTHEKQYGHQAALVEIRHLEEKIERIEREQMRRTDRIYNK